MNRELPNSAQSISKLIDQLAKLSERLDQAISAIAANSLPDIEDSLWHQEAVSAAIRQSIQILRGVTLPAELQMPLLSAASRLYLLNNSYERVVNQAAGITTSLRGMHSVYYGAAGSQPSSRCSCTSYEA